VVITNPLHYAVALRYDQERMAAPVVVAKGRGLVAARIREVAREYEVPIVAAPPLAGLFMAVAQVLAYTYQLRRRRYRAPDEVTTMDDLPIPDDLRYD